MYSLILLWALPYKMVVREKEAMEWTVFYYLTVVNILQLHKHAYLNMLCCHLCSSRKWH